MLQKVVRSTIIDAPIERVWAVLRDFNSHDQWHAVVDQSRIEGGQASSQVGCVRSFSLKDGNVIREQLLTLDDVQHKSTYCIVEATVPLQRYVATVTLKPVTDGRRTFWHWESTFATPPGQERELRDMVAQGVYEAGFENLRRHLQQGADLRAPGSAPMPTALPQPCRQVVVSAYGGPEVLVAQDGVVPAPGPGQVRIRQRAMGVNYFDVYLRRGWIPALLPLPGTPGMEAAGTVLDVGEGVTGLMPGDRVACMTPAPGAYASVRNVAVEHVVRLPAAVDDDVAAALLLKGVTADYLLRDLGRVQPGARWLVHAAAGGVGLLLCAWATHGLQAMSVKLWAAWALVTPVAGWRRLGWGRRRFEGRGCTWLRVASATRFSSRRRVSCGRVARESTVNLVSATGSTDKCLRAWTLNILPAPASSP